MKLTHYLNTIVLLPLILTTANAYTFSETPGEELHQPMLLSDAELENLLAPIALHPDPLIALILPACTAPTDIVRAARYLDSGSDPSFINTMPWEESVIALAHYPSVIRELDDNLDWAIQLGDAFLFQAEGVMRAIQRLRASAHHLGHLSDGPEQSILLEDEVIRIVPASPEVIYVPYYDTRVVYVDRYRSSPTIWYGSYYSAGTWLCYDLHWPNWNIRVVKPHWRSHWQSSTPWRSPRYSARDPFWNGDRFNSWKPRNDRRIHRSSSFRSERRPSIKPSRPDRWDNDRRAFSSRDRNPERKTRNPYITQRERRSTQITDPSNADRQRRDHANPTQRNNRSFQRFEGSHGASTPRTNINRTEHRWDRNRQDPPKTSTFENRNERSSSRPGNRISPPREPRPITPPREIRREESPSKRYQRIESPSTPSERPSVRSPFTGQRYEVPRNHGKQERGDGNSNRRGK